LEGFEAGKSKEGEEEQEQSGEDEEDWGQRFGFCSFLTTFKFRYSSLYSKHMTPHTAQTRYMALGPTRTHNGPAKEETPRAHSKMAFSHLITAAQWGFSPSPKGPLVPVHRIGTKGAARHRRGAAPFSPGGYYQPGLKVLFSFSFFFPIHY
jgi:hypothetical protein